MIGRAVLSLCAAVAMVAGAPAVAVGQTHAFQGQIAASAGVTDNANLAPPDEAVSDGFSGLSPGFLYTRIGLRMIQLFTYRFTAQLYFDHSEANSYSNRVTWLGMFALSRDVRLDLGAEADQGESNNFDIVADPGMAQPTRGGVAFLSTAVTQALLWQIRPVWEAREELTARLLIPIDEGPGRAPGYAFSSVLRSDRSWRRTALGVRYRTTYFIQQEETADDGSVIAEGQQQLITGPDAVLRRDLGSSLMAELSAGVVGATRTDDFYRVGLIIQPVGSAILRFTTARGGASAGYTRGVAPNLLLGEVFLSDAVQVSADYPLLVAQRLWLRGGAGAQRLMQIDVAGESFGDPSYAYMADAAIAWSPNDSLSLAVRYQYRRQDGDEGSVLEDLSANTVMLSVGGSYPSAGPRLDPRRNSQRVDGSDGGDPFGLKEESGRSR